MLKQVLAWLGMMFEVLDNNKNTTTDPMDEPVLRGPKRLRKVSRRYKWHIIKIASEGKGLKSGSHALELLQKFRKGYKLESFKVANKWVNPTMFRYLQCIKLWMWDRPLGVVSLAWDATRLSKMELMFASIWSRGKAFWCPPIVPLVLQILSLQRCKFQTLAGCKYATFLVV